MEGGGAPRSVAADARLAVSGAVAQKAKMMYSNFVVLLVTLFYKLYFSKRQIQ